MKLIRPLPEGPWWLYALGLLAIVGGFIAIVSFPPSALVIVVAGLVIVAGIAVVAEARWVRCPQCGRRLTERKVPVDGGPAYRVFWECPGCVALWDGEMIIDPTRD